MLRDVGGCSHDYNSDGMFTFDRDPCIPTSAYVQLYRNGIIEPVADDVTWFHPADTKKQTRWFIQGADFNEFIRSRPCVESTACQSG